MRKSKGFTISDFKCQSCGTSIPLPRRIGHQREHGHVKDIWCPVCKREEKFMEVRGWECYKTLSGDVIYD